jgi:hypothetical protein
MGSDAKTWQQVSLHACYYSYSIWACFIQQWLVLVRIASVYDRFYLSRFNQLFEEI